MACKDKAVINGAYGMNDSQRKSAAGEMESGAYQVASEVLHGKICRRCRKSDCDFDCSKLVIYDDLSTELAKDLVIYAEKRCVEIYMMKKMEGKK
jgi:hypothetical protein